ncbi:hypothetical protein BGZ94_002657, partial [Podila epigama]
MTVPESVRPFTKVLLLPELVHSIAKYLAPRERHHARRISKAFHRAFQPYISLELAHTLSGNDSDPEKLSIPLEQVPSCGQLVRKYSTTYRGDVHGKYKARAQTVIETTLTHCANVQEVNFDWNSVNEPSAQTILAGFTSLTSLTISITMTDMLHADPILTNLAGANLRHLRSLSLLSIKHSCWIGEWSLVEDLLDACPSLSELAMVRLLCLRLEFRKQYSLPNWFLNTDEVAEFKSYPQLTSLRITHMGISGKGLIFLTHCFPMLQSLEIDRCHFSWTEPIFRLDNPKPKATLATTTSATPNDPEPGPGAKFLNLTHLRQLKVSEYDGYIFLWRHSFEKMIKQMPRLLSLDIDNIPSNIPTFREM